MTKARLLLVDDDSDVRKALARELSRDFDVVSVDGAGSARRALSKGGDFAAVVSDLCMETSTAGAELLEEVQRLRPGCARVLVSGSVSKELTARLRGRGTVNEVVTKPWTVGALVAAVHRALAACKGW